jgi:uncharacterized membrane protein YhaH (DUF805 family)
MHWYADVLRKYADFSGRARRQEYWMFTLVNIIIMFVAFLVANMIHIPWLGFLYWVAVIIPSLAVGVRRLHDTGRSGWWLLIAFVPVVGGLILLYFFVIDGEGDNTYGPNPKGVAAAA